MLENSSDGKIRRGVINEAVNLFGVSRRTVLHIRAKAKGCNDHLSVVKALKKEYKGRVGHKRISQLVIQENFLQSPLNMPGTYASLSETCDVSSSTLYRSL